VFLVEIIMYFSSHGLSEVSTRQWPVWGPSDELHEGSPPPEEDSTHGTCEMPDASRGTEERQTGAEGQADGRRQSTGGAGNVPCAVWPVPRADFQVAVGECPRIQRLHLIRGPEGGEE